MSTQLRKGIVLAAILLVALAIGAQAADLDGIETMILTKEIAQIEQAIELLESHLSANPQDGPALWLTAKAYLYLGDELEDGKLAVFEKGKEYADSAVEVLPDSAHSHYWQSALIGRVGQTRGILSSLFMVKPMKNALDRVLELDQDYADAYWVLSQLYHQAPGFPLSIGNKKLSLENAEIAIRLDPANLEYQLQLAKAQEYNGQKTAAVATLERLLAAPALVKEPKVEAEAAELLAKWDK